eukprot:sb/3476668/
MFRGGTQVGYGEYQGDNIHHHHGEGVNFELESGSTDCCSLLYDMHQKHNQENNTQDKRDNVDDVTSFQAAHKNGFRIAAGQLQCGSEHKDWIWIREEKEGNSGQDDDKDHTKVYC